MGPVENKIRKRRPCVGLKAGSALIGNTIGLCEKINGLRVRQAPATQEVLMFDHSAGGVDSATSTPAASAMQSSVFANSLRFPVDASHS
jgi:hypothetical protein